MCQNWEIKKKFIRDILKLGRELLRFFLDIIFRIFWDTNRYLWIITQGNLTRISTQSPKDLV